MRTCSADDIHPAISQLAAVGGCRSFQSLAVLRIVLLLAALLAACHCPQPVLSSGSPPSARLDVLEVPNHARPVDGRQWSNFIKENLHDDLKHWQAPLNISDLLTLRDYLNSQPLTTVFKYMVIYNNTLLFPDRPDVQNTGCPPTNDEKQLGCDGQMVSLIDRLQAVLAARGHKYELPNVAFMLNSEDNLPRFCGPKRRDCRVPLFSLQKRFGHLENDEDRDILIPTMHYVPHATYHYPWHLKTDKAFFRGRSFCSAAWDYQYPSCKGMCTRTYLAQLSEKIGPNPYIEIGLANQWVPAAPATDCTHMQLEAKPLVPINQHAKYKYLVHLEGITASHRLALLMHINSVVLYQRSEFKEWYYRSLKPNVHYVEFWNVSGKPDDILDVVKELQQKDKQNPEYLPGIAYASMDFALKYLGLHSRLRYFKEALTAYKALFAPGEMDAWVEREVQRMRARGINFAKPTPQRRHDWRH